MPHLGRFTPGSDPLPLVHETGWDPEPVWTGAENLAHTGIRSPDRPARSNPLYRLSYPGPQTKADLFIYFRLQSDCALMYFPHRAEDIWAKW
jgi:hypothetical protein